METLFRLYLYIGLALFGACIGRFLNVVVYRLPKGIFFAEAHSHCPVCEKRLGWRDLIPIVSYFLLQGRCRYCRAKISLRYPIVEAACTLLALLCFRRFGLDLRLVLSFGVSVILLAISLIDLDTMEIPNILILALIPCSICAIWGWNNILWPERVIGFFTISLPMLLMTLAIPDAFGGGDIKLMAICGFLLGWKNVLLAFFLALLAGGSYAVYLLTSGKNKRGDHIAFGPYLCAGVAVALFWGPEIIRRYLNFYM